MYLYDLTLILPDVFLLSLIHKNSPAHHGAGLSFLMIDCRMSVLSDRHLAAAQDD